jgi:hypothetical protein
LPSSVATCRFEIFSVSGIANFDRSRKSDFPVMPDGWKYKRLPIP